ncbi:MAG: hypothetical protein WBK91_02890 [Alphaproteobacteria bacterium]
MHNLDDKFRDLGSPKRVFTVGALEGDVTRVRRLHDHLLEVMQPGDRLVYLGDYVGTGDSLATIEEILLFRRMMMMKPGMEASDFVYLRGIYEEAWQRLMRLPFAREPEKTMERLLDEGADHYLRAYGIDYRSGEYAVRAGIPALTRWIHNLRLEQRDRPGHEQLMFAMRRAAFTRGEQKLLFVPCGFDPSRPLTEQENALWSGVSGFGRIIGPVQGYVRVIRGRDAAGLGLRVDNATLTLDPMEGDGPILCAEILPDGRIVDVIEVQNGTSDQEGQGTEASEASTATTAVASAPLV